MDHRGKGEGHRDHPPGPGARLEPVEHPGSWSSEEGTEPGLGYSALASSPDGITHCDAPWSGQLSLSEPQCLYLQNGNKNSCPASLVGIQ